MLSTHINIPEQQLPGYKYPASKLLNKGESPDITEEEIEENKRRLKEVFSHYDIGVEEVTATKAPTLTLYEFKPSLGIKMSTVRGLEDELSLYLGKESIRIIAPVPERGTIGVEVANANSSVVGMKDVITSNEFVHSQAELPMALGVDVFNQTHVADLAEMPHLLMAGATGQGKSVTLNAMIASLLYKKHPANMKFVMIDPKRVELSMYEKLEGHFLGSFDDGKTSIVSDEKDISSVLQHLNNIMDERYELLERAEVRNIQQYNRKYRAGEISNKTGFSYLPYFVTVVDEFSDLMMNSGKDIEHAITRLAQKSRAVGIHMIIATQRPSSDVITGLIKANFPSRIAFRTSSKTDSRTILDDNGAERLIGKGDMLFSHGIDKERLQSPFIDIDEIEKLMEFINTQHGYGESYPMG